MILLISLALLSVVGASFNFTNSTGRYKRQAPYMCGVDPYKFYSMYPCELYPQCSNGGFKINIGCTSDATCAIYNTNSVCIEQCCCTRPIVKGITTTTRLFRDQGVSSAGSLIAVILSLVYIF